MSSNYMWQEVIDVETISTIKALSHKFDVSVRDYDEAEVLYSLDISRFVASFMAGQKALIQELFPNIRRPYLDDLTFSLGQEALLDAINDPDKDVPKRKDLEMALLHEVLGISLSGGEQIEDFAIPVNCVDIEPGTDKNGFEGEVHVYIPESVYIAQGFTCG